VKALVPWVVLEVVMTWAMQIEVRLHRSVVV
jgi:hypothetical protein